jgi:hypothetical protein
MSVIFSVNDNGLMAASAGAGTVGVSSMGLPPVVVGSGNIGKKPLRINGSGQTTFVSFLNLTIRQICRISHVGPGVTAVHLNACAAVAMQCRNG